MRLALRSVARRVRLTFHEWVERHSLVRYVFLLKELYFTRWMRRHYGQFAEDILLDRIFGNVGIGSYVDVGCYHPVKYNNTYALYRRGWRGVNVDVDQLKIDGFNMVRPRDFNVCRAITDRGGEVPVHFPDPYSLMTSLHEQHVRGFSHYVTKNVKAATLDEILASSPLRDCPIDLLNVDVEGHDLTVLKTLDFDKYRPRIIAVESFAPTLDQLRESELFQFVTRKGYYLVQWAGNSLMFSRC